MQSRLIVASDLTSLGLADRHLRRARSAGQLVRLHAGVYLPSDDWRTLDHRERYVAQIGATLARLSTPVVVSHGSAAALWGFPALDGWPAEVHVLDPARTTGRRSATLVRHPLAAPLKTAVIQGIVCTGAARTALDLACTSGLLSGLLACDDGLRRGLFTRDHLRELVRRRGRIRGIAVARACVDLADPLAGSPGETISRGAAHELGYPRPQLQKRFPNPRGGDYFVDFWWQEQGIIGEFDGDQKYLDAAMRSGRTIEQVILDEKEREDHLRALPEVRNLVRWRYRTARRPTELDTVLTSAGLVRGLATP